MTSMAPKNCQIEHLIDQKIETILSLSLFLEYYYTNKNRNTMHYRFMQTILLLCFTTLLCAQYPITAIHFDGIEKTNESWLQKYMLCRIGETADSTRLKWDQDRLNSLKGLENVRCRLDTTENGVEVHFEAEEIWTLIPKLYFGGINTNFFIEAGFSELNFLRRGYQLSVSYRLADLRSNYYLFARLPNIGGSRWGTSVSLRRDATIEPLYFPSGERVRYRYTVNSVGATAMYEVFPRHMLELGGTFFHEDYLKNNLEEESPGPQELDLNKMLAKLSYTINKVNYFYFYVSGFQNQTRYEMVYTPMDKSRFHLWFNDFRYYKRVAQKKGNIALRAQLGVSSNFASPFAPFVLSSFINVRGIGDRVARGSGLLIVNADYRHTLFENRLFGVQGVGFVDAATWRNSGQKFFEQDTDLIAVYGGLGIRLIYKKAYNSIFRLDYGVDINDTKQGGFVIGLGQFF